MLEQKLKDGELRNGWRAVLACFGVALFVRGFTSYGQAVFLSQLQSLHGWSVSVISGAITLCFICAAALSPWVAPAFHRAGPGAILGGGIFLLALGSIAFSASTQPWQLYPSAIVMGAGSVAASTTAISLALANTFRRKRGLALSLALSGINVSGFTVAPALLALGQDHGLTRAVTEISLGLLVVVLPLIWFAFRPVAPTDKPVLLASFDHSEILGDAKFWSVTAPFALVLAAQIGMLVYQVSYLLPLLGTNGTSFAVMCVGVAAFSSRLSVGPVIDRLSPRSASAMMFILQAISTAILLELSNHTSALYVACILLGVATGTVLILPSLIIQREFSPASFGAVLGLAEAFVLFVCSLTPVALGIIYDAAGSFRPVLGTCIALPLIAAMLVVRAVPSTVEQADRDSK